MSRAQVNVAELYAALDDQRESRGLSWRGLARELGVSPSTMTRLRQGYRPDADGFAAMVAWLGLPADKFIEVQGNPSTQLAETDLMAELGVLLRSRKDLSDKDAEMLESIFRAAYDRVRPGS